jgi:hypothetical protein
VKGIALTGNAIYDAIIRHTAAHFGKSVNPHLFRDGAATFWALEAPAIIEGASALFRTFRCEIVETLQSSSLVAAGRRLAALLRQKAQDF